MRRLLYFQQNSAFGATEEYIVDLALYMSVHGYEVHVVYPALPIMDQFKTALGKYVICHAVHTQRYTASAVFSWVNWFRALKPSIVHFNDPSLIGSGAAWLAHVPIRIVTHHTPELERKYNHIGKLFNRLTSNTYTRYIFTSEYSLETSLARAELKQEKSVVIPYGLRPSWFSPFSKDEKLIVRSELGLTNDDFMIIKPARLSAQKRHDIFLSAAQKVIEEVPQAHFFLAGDGELQKEIENQVKNLGIAKNIHLLGFRRDILQLVSAADIVVMTSDFEGLCYAVIEAGARGVATVATNVGGMRYSIEDGVTGLLVPPQNPREIASALLRLIHDPVTRYNLGLSGRKRAEELFTVQRMVEDTANLYMSLTGAN